jgi:hypothetical protein
MVTVATITSYAFLEFAVGQVRHQLRENGSADVHPLLFRRAALPNLGGFPDFQFKSFFWKK